MFFSWTGDADCHGRCAHRLRNDRGFARGTVERADRGVRPYGWVASSVVGRADVGSVPYAPFTDSIS